MTIPIVTTMTKTIKECPPGTPVDVLYFVSDWMTRQVREHWIHGYRIFDPDSKIKLPKRRRPKPDEVLLVFEGYARPFRKKIKQVRLHDPLTSVSFESVYPKPTGTLQLAGVEIETEQEDLTLGVDVIEEEVYDDF